MDQIEEEEKRQANLNSISTAHLTTVLLNVAHGFSGAKRPPPRTPPKIFLPFPDWEPNQRTPEGPDAPTRFVLAELARSHRIPLHVYSALVSGADDRT